MPRVALVQWADWIAASYWKRPGEQPAFGIDGYAVVGPAGQCAFEGIGQRVLGGGDIACRRREDGKQPAVRVPGDLGHPVPHRIMVFAQAAHPRLRDRHGPASKRRR